MLYWTTTEYECDRGEDWLSEHDTARTLYTCTNCADSVYWRADSQLNKTGMLCAPCANDIEGER